MNESIAPDDITAQRKKELDMRAQNATQRAQALSGLMLGEEIQVSPEQRITAVPNGWLYTFYHKAGVTSTFVPQPPPRPSKLEAPQIIL